MEQKNTHEEEYFGTTSIADWFNGICVAGTNHCGAGCGDGQRNGGGPVRNPLDQCCKNHDVCWSRFGADDSCCDKQLITCTQNQPASVKSVINAVFGANAKKGK